MRFCCICVLLLASCVDNQTHLADVQAYDASAVAAACVPDLNGRIEASELQPALGVQASYRVSPAGQPVDVKGYVDDAGHRVWDWSHAATGDALIHISAQPLANQWYANAFAGGQFVVPFDAAGTLDSIYRQDSGGLWMLGMASSQPAPPEGKTLLPYADPVAILRFPLQVGASWTSTGKTLAGQGILHGLPFASVDTYVVHVDASGRLELPDLTLTQAMRVRTSVTIVPVAGATTTRKQVSFLTECLGEVARATSQTAETQEDFSTAAEVRRLSL